VTAAELAARFPEAVAELYARARREQPELALDERELLAAFAAHVPHPTAAHFERCRAGELALAAAAARGAAPAIAALERQFEPVLAAACRRYARADQSPDDLRQILRTKLFVGAAPAIAEYNGQGSLGAWLRVIATRCFIDLGRRKDRARDVPAGDALDELELELDRDLALDAIKAEYRRAVARALRTAATRLAPGERHLLRQHLVGGLSIDQLAAVLGLHRATAARRLARARQQLATAVRDHLVASLELDECELAHVFELVLSKLDVSLRRILATPAPT